MKGVLGRQGGTVRGAPYRLIYIAASLYSNVESGAATDYTQVARLRVMVSDIGTLYWVRSSLFLT